MKRNRLVLCFFLMILLVIMLLPGCGAGGEGESGRQDSNSIVEMVGDAKIFNNDPGENALSDAYDETSLKELVEGGEHGDVYAKYLLGIVYLGNISGFEVDPNVEKGIELLEQAWEQGVVDAGYSLFDIYYYGSGVDRNPSLAVDYLQVSAEMGYIISQKTLAYAYFGRILKGYFSIDYELAREWFSKAAEQGDKESATQLAQIYYDGLGVAKNDELAFEWLSRVEDMEYGSVTFGINGLALSYEEGIGTDVDLVQAYKFYDLLGTSGIPDKKRLVEKMTLGQIDEAIRLSYEWQLEHNISMPNSDGYRYR